MGVSYWPFGLAVVRQPSLRRSVTPRLVDPNRVRGARPYIETLYLIVFIFYFFKIIKISYTYQKNYHRSGVHQNLYTYAESHLQIQNRTFTFTNQSTEHTVMNPY